MTCTQGCHWLLLLSHWHSLIWSYVKYIFSLQNNPVFEQPVGKKGFENIVGKEENAGYYVFNSFQGKSKNLTSLTYFL